MTSRRASGEELDNSAMIGRMASSVVLRSSRKELQAAGGILLRDFTDYRRRLKLDAIVERRRRQGQDLGDDPSSFQLSFEYLGEIEVSMNQDDSFFRSRCHIPVGLSRWPVDAVPRIIGL